MNAFQAYKEMCRDKVHDQGDPEDFDAAGIRLTDHELGIALRKYDDVLAEISGDVIETVCACLKGQRVADLFGNTRAEAVGVVIIAAVRERLIRTVRNDLECEASDMVLEALEDKEHERGVSV